MHEYTTLLFPFFLLPILRIGSVNCNSSLGYKKGGNSRSAITSCSTPLCHNCRIPLRAQNIHHHSVGRQDAGLQHGKDTGIAAGYQRDTLVIESDRLLPITAIHIPEHQIGQLISMLREELACILKVRHRAIFGAVMRAFTTCVKALNNLMIQ